MRNPQDGKIHDQTDPRPRCELHQIVGEGVEPLSTAQSAPVADDQNALKVGAPGPALVEDFHFREKMFHFDRERIPERVVDARGYGAHGFFETYECLSHYTGANMVLWVPQI